MPVAIVVLLLDLTLVWHAAKTGRLQPWAFIILGIPLLGAFAYILIVLIPDWMGSTDAQNVKAAIRKKLDPHKRLRELNDKLADADTIANRVAVANECLSLGRYSEANEHFDAVLRRPMGEEPAYMLGKAKAQFGLHHFDSTIATLDDLRARWPDFQSAEGHLIYARALEGAGRSQEALAEYEALSGYFPGAEARVRFGMLLMASGQTAEAREILHETLERLRRMPDYVRKAEAEWIALAERALRV
ncbi:MAG TPA: tetratricopeptide repeat protein [Pseudorhodoplanes sp.]|nr:tetratricopeptide repeat protein [Pseudorhodoplanes sp.]